MLDIKLLRQDRERIQAKLRAKQSDTDLGPLLSLDERLRELKHEAEELKSKRNALSKQIGEAKRAGKEATALLEEVSGLGDRVELLDVELRGVEEHYQAALDALVNIPMDGLVESMDPSQNVCVKEWGTKPHFAFTPKHHLELNEKLHLFDFPRGAKIAGAGWPVLTGMGARLEWALLQFMMDHHIKRGWHPFMVPHCVRPEVVYGSGQLPKFGQQLYQLRDDEHPLYLIPTAEVPLNGMHLSEILDEAELPKRYVCYSPCFRREAGAAGEKERGLIRVHQFNKVEMYAIARPEESEEMFKEMVESVAALLEALGLHHRMVSLVTGELGVAAAKTYDAEVWLPAQNRYYEVSSISHCTDYQARRSQIRYRLGQRKPELVHTLNGSGLATPRLVVALLENNQREDGSVEIPFPLRAYLGGKETL